MTLPVDFTSQEYFRDPAAGIAQAARSRAGRRGQVPDHRQGLDHDDAGAGRPRAERQRDVHACARTAARCRPALVDAGHRSARSPTTCSPWTSRTTRGCAASSTRPFAAAPSSTWSRASSPSPTSSPTELFADGSPADLVERYARRLPLVGHLRAARPAGRRPAEVHRLDQQLHAPDQHDGLPAPDSRASPRCGAICEAHSRHAREHGRRRSDCRAGPRREGRRAHQRRRDGGDGVSAAWRRNGDHDASDQRIGLRADERSGVARLAGGGLEPRQPGDRGIPALRLAGAVHQAPLRAHGRGARRRSAEEGRQDHGHAGAANMDPEANEHPERLDLERRPNRHLAFGTGIHFCLGHQLARIEGKCALQALFKRWPNLELAVPTRRSRGGNGRA